MRRRKVESTKEFKRRDIAVEEGRGSTRKPRTESSGGGGGY